MDGKHVFCYFSRCVICWLCLSKSRLRSPQSEIAWACFKSPNGCSRGRVHEVCYKEGSDVAPMGTESATVLWSRDVSRRIKEHEGVCASLKKSLCDSWQFARSQVLAAQLSLFSERHCRCDTVLAASDQGSRITGERIGQHWNQRRLRKNQLDVTGINVYSH
jgi:hypothetical protein